VSMAGPMRMVVAMAFVVTHFVGLPRGRRRRLAWEKSGSQDR
jgi:hypothetical protein